MKIYPRYHSPLHNTRNTQNKPPPPPSPLKVKNQIEYRYKRPTSHIIQSRSMALIILKLYLTATSREIILQYRSLACRFYLDKWKSDLVFTKEYGIEYFKSIANAREYLLHK